MRQRQGYGRLKKLMIKSKTKKIKTLIYNAKLSTLLVLAVLVVSAISVPIVRADRFDEQINQLNADNAQKRAAKDQLGAAAASLQDQINRLQAQINELSNQISTNEAKSADVQRQIEEAQAELARQKKVLGENIRQMYLEGDMSTLEMLASSKDLSEFVDKEQYREAVQSKIKNTLDKITELKHQLSAQKETLDKLLADQHAMQDQQTAQQSELNGLLSLNEQQQNDLNTQIKNNFAQISSLRAQQAAENARLFRGANFVGGSACDTGHGDTYPAQYCAIPQDSVVDAWGMFNRECVSYTAWKVYESGRHMPYWGGIGNANQWDDNARAANIPVDESPRAGDVAIKNSLPYGHAMYVESVNSDGTINISQYNANLDGRFSRAYNVSPGGLVFIHF